MGLCSSLFNTKKLQPTKPLHSVTLMPWTFKTSCTQVWICTFMSICICIHIYIYVGVCMCIYNVHDTHKYINIYVYIYMSIYVGVCFYCLNLAFMPSCCIRWHFISSYSVSHYILSYHFMLHHVLVLLHDMCYIMSHPTTCYIVLCHLLLYYTLN